MLGNTINANHTGVLVSCSASELSERGALLEVLELLQCGNAAGASAYVQKLRRSGQFAKVVSTVRLNVCLECASTAKEQKINQDGHAKAAARDVKATASPCALPTTASSLARAHALSKLPGLTRKQRRVVALLSTGCTNIQISKQLRISRNTVKWHLKTISRVLGANNRLSIVHIAQSKGLLEFL